MYLRKVALRNIKCFADFELDFAPGGHPRFWTAILGHNGLGKSTLLQAIGVALAGPGAIRELLPVAEGWVSRSKVYGEIEAELLWTEGDAQTPHWPQTKTPYIARYAVIGEAAEPATLPQSLSQAYAGVPTIAEWPGEGMPREREKVSKHMSRLKQTAYAEGKRGWFACGYGPFRRLSGGAQAADRILYSGRKSARFITLFREDAALTNATDWLISLYNTGRDGDETSQRILEQVRGAFQADLLPRPAELLVNAHSALFKVDGQSPVPFRDLSDGYRSMLAMGIDLLRWVSLAYPEAENLMAVSGVVLIDELDAHAHPAWQREVGHWLRHKFPKLQFIIATHSPFLAQVADEPGGNVVLTQTPQGVKARDDVESVEGWRADQILTDLQELSSLRSPEAERKIARLRELAQRRHALRPDEIQQYEQLRLWAEELPPAVEDPRERRQAALLQRQVAAQSERIKELE
jgi:energy-coupling factor transporter ATP-binding protein EcfA2